MISFMFFSTLKSLALRHEFRYVGTPSSMFEHGVHRQAGYSPVERQTGVLRGQISYKSHAVQQVSRRISYRQ